MEKEKEILQQKCAEAFEQMCVLQEARQQLLEDLQDKNIALQIDVGQHTLKEQSPSVSYKPDPLRVPKGFASIDCHFPVAYSHSWLNDVCSSKFFLLKNELHLSKPFHSHREINRT